MTSLEDPRWLALSEERRDALLEKHRNTNVEWGEWWDSAYETFVKDCVEKGICVDTIETVGGKQAQRHSIYFSGFWSQGDGACFDGHVIDWPKFLVAAGRPELTDLYEKLTGLCEKLTDPLCLSWCHSGHYYHSYCTSFRSDLHIENPFDEEDDVLQYATWDTITENGDVFVSLEDDFIEYVRGLMDDLYTTLEEEYDYLTSDEVVVEYILDHCEEELVEEDEDELSLEH